MKCYRQIPGIKWNWTQTRLRLKRRKRTAPCLWAYDFDNCSRRTACCHSNWTRYQQNWHSGSPFNGFCRETRCLEITPRWISGSLDPPTPAGKTGQPEKAAHRPWFRPTAQQCSDWTFAHLTDISYVYKRPYMYLHMMYKYTYILSY